MCQFASVQAIEQPVRTNQIPRQIPEQSFFTKPIPGIVMGGILPFGCIFIQLFFILNSIWYKNKNSLSGFCFCATIFHIFINMLCLFQVSSDVLHVWIPVPGFHHSAHHLLWGNNSALLLPPLCWGTWILCVPQVLTLVDVSLLHYYWILTSHSLSYVLRTTTGGGDPSWPAALQQSICLSMLYTTSSQSCKSLEWPVLYSTLDTRWLWSWSSSSSQVWSLLFENELF